MPTENENFEFPPDLTTSRGVLAEIQQIRSWYIDDRPVSLLDANSPNYARYKYRKIYFTQLRSLAGMLIGIHTDKKFVNHCQAFMDFSQNEVGRRGNTPDNWITPNDVKRADEFIAYLENFFKERL